MMFYINNEYIEKAYALLKDQEISNDLSIDFGMTKHIKQLKSIIFFFFKFIIRLWCKSKFKN